MTCVRDLILSVKAMFYWFVVGLAWLTPYEGGAQILTGPITNSANGHWYYLLAANYWTNAEAQAVTLGGHLVTINDAAENTWVLDTFGRFGGAGKELLIGLTDEGHEGDWRWLNGEAVTYLNWAPGEPNNGAGFFPFENYAMMHSPDSGWPQGSWNDLMGSLEEQQYWGVVEVGPLLSIRVSQVELCWPTITNAVYQLQYQSSITGTNWTNLGSPLTASGSSLCITDDVPPGRPQRFYRVVNP